MTTPNAEPMLHRPDERVLVTRGLTVQFGGTRAVSEFDLEVDVVVFAVGQGPNPLIGATTPALMADKRGCLIADPATGLTSMRGVFAGGDIVTGGATVISAMGAGRRAARAIDEWLGQA